MSALRPPKPARTAWVLAALALLAGAGAPRAQEPRDAAEQKERARAQVTQQAARADERERLEQQRPSGAPSLAPPANEERPGDRPPEDRPGQRVGEEHAQPADHNAIQAPARAQGGPRTITQRRVAPRKPAQLRPRMPPGPAHP